jgi:hypothetical protein
MKNLILILLVLSGLFMMHSCKKDGGGNNGNSDQNNNNNNNKDKNKDTTTNNPPPVISPAVTVAQTPLTILLPQNCMQSFTITNSGPQGSTMDYTVADDGALGGFLSFTNAAGTLNSGASVTIAVSVKPAFINASPSLIGASLVLDVYTPKATNFTKIPVPVKIKSITGIAPLLVGTWAGTWTGSSYGINNPGQAQPTSPVSGTWTVVINTIDTVALTATGSLTWNGTDAYWTYIFDTNGLITTATPVAFIPDRTIQFDKTNTTFSYPTPGSNCTMLHLRIGGFDNQPNPSDAFYGPQFTADFDIGTNTVSSTNAGFSAHPYAPGTFATNVSSGTVTGKKQ